MKRAFILRDKKPKTFWALFQRQNSNVFWTIHYDEKDTCIVINYGEIGTMGKYKVKEYKTNEQVTREAEKLIASKLKEGYEEDWKFDFDNHFYFDDNDFGLHRKTSHPKFVAHFTRDFYYDDCDEDAPFGSEGSLITLCLISDLLEKNPLFFIPDYPRQLVEGWEIVYMPVTTLEVEEIHKLPEEKQLDMEQCDLITYTAAFTQVKITGKLDPGLKEAAIASIKRYAILKRKELSETQKQMIEDLETFS